MLPIDKRPLALGAIFDQVADDYDAIRPGYPGELIDDIVALAGLPANGTILEIGCGTGQATTPFARRGYHMTCLDIGPALIARAALKCQHYPNVQFRSSSFEEWPAQPATYDLVISATAFHWIPPEIGYPKAAQLLKRSGALAIFSNEHPTPFTDFFADVQEVYGRVVPAWKSPLLNAPIEARIAQTAARIDATRLFAPVIVKTYSWSRVYTAQEYVRLLNTYSDHRSLEDATRTELHQGIAAMIDTKYNGVITKPYLSVLYLAKQA
jgi:SAM-dependent methyltransferase